MWVSLLEKAWAKFKGGYGNIKESHASEAFEALTGEYTKQINISPWNKDKLWNILKNSEDFPICAGTGDFFFGKSELETEHEYMLVKVFEEGKKKKLC